MELKFEKKRKQVGTSIDEVEIKFKKKRIQVGTSIDEVEIKFEKKQKQVGTYVTFNDVYESLALSITADKITQRF